MKFLKRNAVIFIFAVGLVGAIGLLILEKSKHPTKGPNLTEISEESLIATHTYTRGDPEAPISLVVFIDFDDKESSETYKKIITMQQIYKDVIKVALRHFPQTQQTKKAALASQIAGELGNFWGYTTKLFENQQDKFDNTTLINHAKSLNLDMEKFERFLNDKNFEALIDIDIKDAEKFNVTDTPTVFLNGERMKVENISDFEEQIRELALKHMRTSQSINTASTKESTDTVAPTSDYTEKLEELTKVIEISYTQEGWDPKITTGNAGQKVKWTNTMKEPITFRQLDFKFDEFREEKTILPGETMEFTLYKEKLWSYEEKLSKNYGAIFIHPLEP